MRLSSTPFEQLPFSALYRDYISNFSRLSDFYDVDPFSEKETSKKIESYSFQGNRQQLVENLRDYNRQFTSSEIVFQSVDKLLDENSMAVVTGQQLTIYGGPLFTILKILTVIHQSKVWENKFNRPFVPVFWMADEDHDFEEAAVIGSYDHDEFKKVVLEAEDSIQKRVSEIIFEENFGKFSNEFLQLLVETDFSGQIQDLLNNTYKKGASFSDAFGRLIISMFAHHGLILAGTNSDKIKRAVTEPIMNSVRKSDEIFEALNINSEKLQSAGYHRQVHIQTSNLFWIADDGAREKISYSEGEWNIESKGLRWDSVDLIDEINKDPNRFSPNVFLRPLTQSYLLPCAAYVAGPSEIAYYGQMKVLYRLFKLDMPVILPRFSATIIESGIDRIIEKLPFEKFEYNKRIEDLESEYISQSDTTDIESIFSSWKKAAGECSKSSIQAIAEIDATLESSAVKAITSYYNELDKLKGKVYRSLKEQEKIQLIRLRRIQNSLFPNGNLQEREVAFIYFMNKYGPDIWDNMLQLFEGQKPDSHKWIYL